MGEKPDVMDFGGHLAQNTSTALVWNFKNNSIIPTLKILEILPRVSCRFIVDTSMT